MTTAPTKRALSIGINYFGTSSELRGCINDTKDMTDLLIKAFGYEAQNITILTDAQANPVKPTRDVILQAMRDHVAKTQAGDTLFIHYSGHGTYTKDRSLPQLIMASRAKAIDEPDGRDEMICPCEGEYIRDDELYEILVKPFPAGAKLRVVFDSCHSGSALDLPLRCNDAQGIVKENDREQTDQDIVMISGCRDDQTSADAFIGGYKGALTWGFVKVCTNLKKSRGLQVNRLSWKQLITVIRYTLRNKKFDQIAQLSATSMTAFDKPIDP